MNKTFVIELTLILLILLLIGCSENKSTNSSNSNSIVGSWEEYRNYDCEEGDYQNVEPDESFWYFTSNNKFLILHRNNGSYTLETNGVLSYEILDNYHILIAGSINWKYDFLNSENTNLLIEDEKYQNKYWFNKVDDAPNYKDYLP
ncbi:MAG: hypothetical protein K8R73_02905 [Clostridiales bacterium]|nr:hypothetical protein [Clostridiales bacterium]